MIVLYGRVKRWWRDRGQFVGPRRQWIEMDRVIVQLEAGPTPFLDMLIRERERERERNSV